MSATRSRTMEGTEVKGTDKTDPYAGAEHG